MKNPLNSRWSPVIGTVLIAGCLLWAQHRLLDDREPDSSGSKNLCQTPVTEHGITQVATIDSLLAGVYDGATTLERLGQYGDFGIGTFDRLDGEMVLFEGIFYQVKSDGLVYRPKRQTTTPFAAVVPFPSETVEEKIDGPKDFEAIRNRIDQLAPNQNVPVAVLLEGRFSQVRTRSVPAQEKPYKILAEVTKNQPEFDLGEIDGQVIGFRLPPYVAGINVPGYHLHFLDRDRKRGGHLLNFSIESGIVKLADIHRFQIMLPEHDDFSNADLSKDRSEELEQVEK